MKNLFNTLIKASLVAVLLSGSLFASTASAAIVTITKAASNPDIKKVVVLGNVKVTLVQNKSEFVTMDELFLDRVSVKQIGQTLTISSTEKIPVSVTVYVKDIYRISVADQASVRTAGKCNFTNLQVIVKDDATARVKATTQSLYTVISDRAKLELLGTTVNHIYKMSGVAKIDTNKFAALKTDFEASTTEAVVLNTVKDTAHVKK
jgi:hypothetical protein